MLNIAFFNLHLYFSYNNYKRNSYRLYAVNNAMVILHLIFTTIYMQGKSNFWKSCSINNTMTKSLENVLYLVKWKPEKKINDMFTLLLYVLFAFRNRQETRKEESRKLLWQRTDPWLYWWRRYSEIDYTVWEQRK